MSDLIKALETLEETALGSLVGASDVEGLEKWRLEVLGRRGSLAETLKGLGTLTADQRPQAGQVARMKTAPSPGRTPWEKSRSRWRALPTA